MAPGTIKHVQFQNVICKGESGIVVFGTQESVIEDVSFDNVSVRMKESPLNDIAGGNFDLRPVLDPKLQIFAHDIPALYAQYVKGLRINNVDVHWDEMNETYFTRGIEVGNFEDVSISGFRGTSSPSNTELPPILLREGKGYNIQPTENNTTKKHVRR